MVPEIGRKTLPSSSRVKVTKNKQHGRKFGDTYQHSGSGLWMDRKDSTPIRTSVGGASVYSCGPAEVCCFKYSVG